MVPATAHAHAHAPAAPAPASPPSAGLMRRLKADAAAWLAFVKQPMSLRTAWRLSGNRPALFAVLLLLPTMFNAPILRLLSRKPATEVASGGPAASTAAGPPAARGLIRQKADTVGRRILNSRPASARPMAVRAAWRLSSVEDARRIPTKSRLVAFLWFLSNCSDRVLLFAVLPFTPTGLNGLILWCAVRPTRRWGLYTVLFVLSVVRG